MLNIALVALLLLVVYNSADPTAQLLEHSRRLSGSGSGSGSGDGNDNIAGFPFDATQYSFKYTRCQTVTNFSSQAAYYGMSNVFSTRRFAILRLCPSTTCSTSNNYGCDQDYGEYMIELSTYLEIMKEYYSSQKAVRCSYCNTCVTAQNQYVNGNYGSGCEDYDECYSLMNSSTCKNYNRNGRHRQLDDNNNNNNNSNFYVENYFACAAVYGTGSDGTRIMLYAGPTCGSDGLSLSFALYSDYSCTTYVGDEYSLQTFTGKTESDISSSMDTYLSKDCMSCSELSYKGDNNNDAYYYPSVSETCDQIYAYSAHCEEKIPSSVLSSASNYNTQQQTYTSKETSQSTCSFINNILRGSYNQADGQIYINKKSYAKQSGYHTNPDQHVTGAQKFWLTAFILGSVGMAGYAAVLHKSIIANNFFTADNVYNSGYIS